MIADLFKIVRRLIHDFVVRPLMQLANYVAPERAHFVVVKGLTEKEIISLPRAPSLTHSPWITALFAYSDPRVRALIWELKYRANTRGLDTIGRLLYEHMTEVMADILTFDSDATFILLPVPLSEEKRADRGYNQSEYICREIVAADEQRTLLYAPQWLRKTIDTPPQSHTASREERLHNLKNCFEADHRTANHYAMVVDDVTTTGATLSEIRRTLLDTGVKEVYAFTIAH